MTSGIRRKVDDLGRVVIPAGIRRTLGIREGDALEVSVQGEEVVLSKPVEQCVFCRTHQGLRTFRDKAVCATCAAGVGTLETGADTAVTDARDAEAEVPRASRPEQRSSEHRPAPSNEGGLRVVEGEAISPPKRQELPASTTAW